MSRDRQPAYSELLQSLLALRPDLAGDRFDRLLAELLADDRIDAAAARELRWWQRESVRAVGDYLDQTAPALLTALESAQQVAEQATHVAADAWAQATAPDPGQDPAHTPEPPDRPVPSPAEPGRAPHPPARGSAASGGAARGTAPADPAPDVVVDLRTGRGRGPGPTPPSATGTPAPGTRPPTVASPRNRLLITGRVLQPERPDAP